MLYFFASRLMSLISYFVFYKLFINSTDLNLLDRSFGWFLIEHIFEEYSMTPGKFFLTSIDFRTLIKNFLIIVRNVLVWSHFWTLLEFILTISVLILLFFVLFYFFEANIIKKRKEVAILSYYVSVIYATILRTFILFNLFDIYFIFKPIFIFVTFFFIVRHLCKAIVGFYYIILSKRNKIDFTVTGIKTIFYIVCVFVISLVLINIVLTTNIIADNLSQEFLVKILLLYTYWYYTYSF